MFKLSAYFLFLVGPVACIHGCKETPKESPTQEPAVIGRADAGSDDERKLDRAIEIVFSKPGYTFTIEETARGISIDYEILVERELRGILPLPQGSAGDGITMAVVEGDEEKPGGLIPFEKLEGNGQRYGHFDIGLPPPREEPPVTIPPGRYQHTFQWDGRNWNGGSDTSRPKGDPFPPGTYTLDVSCDGLAVTEGGPARFRIEKQVMVTLTK